ncbi:hypothetical protein QQF64_019016 [Cirrhinus molitorella]|uniref:Uncharacterized protein n=1 Tax=Cirrhinus molitorella TaxID=172907 RepID=A0ABR3LFP7_9TELE
MRFNLERVLENRKLHGLLWMSSRALFPIHFQSLIARLRKGWLWFFPQLATLCAISHGPHSPNGKLEPILSNSSIEMPTLSSTLPLRRPLLFYFSPSVIVT